MPVVGQREEAIGLSLRPRRSCLRINVPASTARNPERRRSSRSAGVGHRTQALQSVIRILQRMTGEIKADRAELLAEPFVRSQSSIAARRSSSALAPFAEQGRLACFAFAGVSRSI